MERIACRTRFSREEGDVHAVMKCIGAVSLAGMVVWVLVLGISVAVRRAARKWDEKKKILSNDPIHDWSSHGSDAFRYLSLVVKERILPKVIEPPPATELHEEPICLEDLFQEYESRQKRRRRMNS